MSKDAALINKHTQSPLPERSAGFYVRAGWVLTLVGAGSFFLWASLALCILGNTCPDSSLESPGKDLLLSLTGSVHLGKFTLAFVFLCVRCTQK